MEPRYITGRYLYHSSNPKNRKSIAKHGLLPKRSDQWLYDTPIKGKAIFATDSEDRKHHFDSTYDDDFWKIDTHKCPEVQWAKDPNFNQNYKHVYTKQSIPPHALELVHKGTGVDMEGGDDQPSSWHYPNESIRKTIRSVIQELYRNNARTKTAKEILNLANNSKLTSDQRLANSNGDLQDLFDYFMNIFKSKGRNLPDEFGEDEENAFYDFALNYDKGVGYWKRMGEKIFGDMWGYGTGVDANPSIYERFMIVSVDDDKVDEAVRRVHEFGWWCSIGKTSPSLEQTALVVSPVKLN